MNPFWRRAKASGSWGESKAVKLLVGLGCDARRVPGHGDHDVEVVAGPPDMPLGTLEIKRDLKAAESGRLAVEIARDSRPSGISTSTADWWAFVLSGEILFIATEALRSLSDDPRYPHVMGGDGGRTSMVLVPYNELRAAAKHILPTRSRRKHGPAWSPKDQKTNPAANRYCFPHQQQDTRDPRRPGWISSTCNRCERFIGWRPEQSPESESQEPRRRPKKGPQW